MNKKIDIIYEDRYFYAVNKPSSVIVNKSKSALGFTVQDFAIEKSGNLKISEEEEKSLSKKIRDQFLKRQGIVHRLDKDTSGLLLIAKNAMSFQRLQEQFAKREVKKRYLALVHGKINLKNGLILAPVGRLPWNRRKFGVNLKTGRKAKSKYRVLAYYKKEKRIYTYIEVRPSTGRTHQIRVHLKHIGHSVVSDILYAGRKTYRQDIIFCPRLFLHAYYLEFTHPEKKKIVKLEIKLAQDLQKTLEIGLEKIQN